MVKLLITNEIAGASYLYHLEYNPLETTLVIIEREILSALNATGFSSPVSRDLHN